MNKYIIKYWTEHNDEPTDWEIEIEARDEVEAFKKFFDKRIVYRKIEGIRLK